MNGWHNVQLSMWISFILFPINICLFLHSQHYIDLLTKCWKYQIDFVVSMTFFTNFGYMTSMFVVTLYRKRIFKWLNKKMNFVMSFVFCLIFVGFIPMIQLIIYPNDTSFLNWITEPIFGKHGNLLNERSCQYSNHSQANINDISNQNGRMLTSGVIFSAILTVGVAWMCYIIVKYVTNTK